MLYQKIKKKFGVYRKKEGVFRGCVSKKKNKLKIFIEKKKIFKIFFTCIIVQTTFYKLVKRVFV